ncbi:MAG: tetraacyldisaccharide 4'-kinase, partial [Gramella sp.]|nr:tetraacyldisaccharide 4'-kinase [Christiangramia sp.]
MPNPRKLLFPFSLIYHGVTEVRNKLYDQNILKSRSYDLPVIAVGNLNMGGTGKSPMIEYLLKILGENHKIATLSRGYKRESKGFQLIQNTDAVSVSGDEPLQFKNKYPETIVAVDANRQKGISELRKLSPDIILLDDAFQHRKVRAGFYILLTAYGDLYVDDLILPAGNLRESSGGAGRADVIVVTKCPANLKSSEMDIIKDKLNPRSHQAVYFSTIKYSDKIFSASNEKNIKDINDEDWVLVTGIANPGPLLDFLKSQNKKLRHSKFLDHHNFSDRELK